MNMPTLLFETEYDARQWQRKTTGRKPTENYDSVTSSLFVCQANLIGKENSHIGWLEKKDDKNMLQCLRQVAIS